MTFKTKEILKTSIIIVLILIFIIYGIIIFIEATNIKIFSIITVTLLAVIYWFNFKNDLEQIENEYNNDINEYDKKWGRQIEDTQKDLEKRGMTFSGEAVKKLGTMSAYAGQPKGELEIDRDDYKKYRTKRFELDFKKAKYKVLINLFKK